MTRLADPEGAATPGRARAADPWPGAVTPIRVLLADDDAHGRALSRARFGTDGRLDVVAEARDGFELQEVLHVVRADAILLDLVMPRRDGLQVLEDLAGKPARPAIVVMSMHEDAGHVDRALALGAQGYVLKSAPLDEIVSAVTHAVCGGVYLQPSIAKAVVQRHLLLATSAHHTSAALSRRQLELLRALAIGLSNKEIAHLLDLTPGTVNDYMKELFARLGVASRAAAVSTGMRRGLIS